MRSLVAGAIVLSFTMIFALSDANLKLFLNYHSIVLVMAGTLGVFFVSNPSHEIKSALAFALKQAGPQQAMAELHEQLLAVNRKKMSPLTKPHPLVAYAQELWEKGADADMFEALLIKRLHELNNNTIRIVASLRNLSKYPPALGMTGTVFGMVSLFSNLAPETRGILGPSLAAAMTATFYGLVLANVLLMPLADRIHIWHMAESESNEYAVKILLMIHRGDGETIVQDEVQVRAA